MGQYHSVYNIDKKEAIHPHHLGDGAKLLEWGASATAHGLVVLLSNSNGRGGGDLNVHHDYIKNSKGEYMLTKEQLADTKAIAAVAGRWAGDRIVVQGDYAREGDRAFIPEEDLEKFKDISALVVRALGTDEYLRERFFKTGYLTEKYAIPALNGKKPKGKK